METESIKDELQKSINELRNGMDKVWELQKITHIRLENLEKETRLAGRMFDELRSDAEKLYEVYYKVFPERVGQDLRFLDQYDAIMGKTASKDISEKP